MNTHTIQIFETNNFFAEFHHAYKKCDLCNEPAMNEFNDEICRFCERTFCKTCIKWWIISQNCKYSVCIQCLENIEHVNHTYFATTIKNLGNNGLVKKPHIYNVIKTLLLISNRKNEHIKKYIPTFILKKHIIYDLLSIMQNEIK